MNGQEAEAVADDTFKQPPQEGGALVDVGARFPWNPGLANQYGDLGVNRQSWRVLVDAIFPTARTFEAVTMALAYCRTRKLDPFKKQVHIVPMYNRALGREVETVWPSISELRTTAFRTGQYAGMDTPEFGKLVTEKFKDKDGDFEVAYPEWCRITVRRFLGAAICVFVGPTVYWKEAYATQGRTEAPNSMWRERPIGQLEKCAEAAALRRAFPEELGSEYVSEEMSGRAIAGVESLRGGREPPANALATRAIEVLRPNGEAEDGDIDELGLHEGFSKALRRVNVTSIAQVERMTDDELLNIDRIGPKAVEQIRVAIIEWHRAVAEADSPEAASDAKADAVEESVPDAQTQTSGNGSQGSSEPPQAPFDVEATGADSIDADEEERPLSAEDEWREAEPLEPLEPEPGLGDGGQPSKPTLAEQFKAALAACDTVQRIVDVGLAFRDQHQALRSSPDPLDQAMANDMLATYNKARDAANLRAEAETAARASRRPQERQTAPEAPSQPETQETAPAPAQAPPSEPQAGIEPQEDEQPLYRWPETVEEAIAKAGSGDTLRGWARRLWDGKTIDEVEATRRDIEASDDYGRASAQERAAMMTIRSKAALRYRPV